MACPPYVSLAASTRDETAPPTVRRRPLYLVEMARSPQSGYSVTDLYVRRFWGAALGAEAVADLLRIVQAGKRGNSLRRPLHLPILLRAGLIHVEDRLIFAPDRIRALAPAEVERFPPSLRIAHNDWVRLLPAESAPAGN